MSRRCLSVLICVSLLSPAFAEDAKKHDHHEHLMFDVKSVGQGAWSNPKTWEPARVPKAGDRVLISRGSDVIYDVKSPAVIRLVQVAGKLRFARDKDTELNVALLKVQNSLHCSESGFACDFHSVNKAGEPHAAPDGEMPLLEIGTPESPIPAAHTAKIRLHHVEGLDKNDAPAIACCSARMEIHGSPLNHTWVKLSQDVAAGSNTVHVAKPLTGWRVGDEVIVTGSVRKGSGGSYRNNPEEATTEQRRIKAINGNQIQLDQPLAYEHSGSGRFHCEIANLSRNVIIESADPDGVRGHTVYHRFSKGGISYARFAHLGKEGVLGRYAIHFHLVGDTMRGSQVKGVAIVDSENRWITIHGTQYLVVRDCIGYKSVGHGYFLEDGTEVYNLLDHNLAVHAYRGRRLPDQVLPFDPNDGAGFWWANGRNTLVRNVTCENDEYGYRYDMQKDRRFDAQLPILTPEGKEQLVDVRTIPIWRFEDNEAHTEGFYGMVVAANGNSQPDSPIPNQKSLENMRRIDWTGPDTQHPHTIRNLKIWGAHYAFRPHSPSMLMENVFIHKAAYGIYRPAFENQVYKNLEISMIGAEPFNRGMDDASAQLGKITVDGLTFTHGYGNSSTPLVQISDINMSGDAETHFRNVKVNRPQQFQDRWPLINRGVGPRIDPITNGVPIYIHDHFGPGRHAKVVSTAAKDLMNDGNDYRSLPTITGKEARAAEVTDVEWPKLLDPVDDLPPATIITSVREDNGSLHVEGLSHDNGAITKIQINGRPADVVSQGSGVVDWRITLQRPLDGELVAAATDESGNTETATAHRIKLPKKPVLLP